MSTACTFAALYICFFRYSCPDYKVLILDSRLIDLISSDLFLFSLSCNLRVESFI